MSSIEHPKEESLSADAWRMTATASLGFKIECFLTQLGAYPVITGSSSRLAVCLVYEFPAKHVQA